MNSETHTRIVSVIRRGIEASGDNFIVLRRFYETKALMTTGDILTRGRGFYKKLTHGSSKIQTFKESS